MIDCVVSQKVFAVGCVVNGDQFTAECLYLREPLAEPEKVHLYNSDRQLIAVVKLPKTNIQVHHNITLQICR